MSKNLFTLIFTDLKAAKLRDPAAGIILKFFSHTQAFTQFFFIDFQIFVEIGIKVSSKIFKQFYKVIDFHRDTSSSYRWTQLLY